MPTRLPSCALWRAAGRCDAAAKPEKQEKFTFGKDYAELENTTTFKLDIEQKPLEPSWGVGVGYNSDKRLEGIFTARIKKTPLHLWGTTDGHHGAVGIMFSTNYK